MLTKPLFKDQHQGINRFHQAQLIGTIGDCRPRRSQCNFTKLVTFREPNVEWNEYSRQRTCYSVHAAMRAFEHWQNNLLLGLLQLQLSVFPFAC
mmetsp:Transcript_927/g.2670  ORF Transcript_927/g.2670 Transcript_927/m.2670 type:complete len:94 (+) Transcript_927:953-1234(+)